MSDDQGAWRRPGSGDDRCAGSHTLCRIQRLLLFPDLLSRRLRRRRRRSSRRLSLFPPPFYTIYSPTLLCTHSMMSAKILKKNKKKTKDDQRELQSSSLIDLYNSSTTKGLGRIQITYGMFGMWQSFKTLYKLSRQIGGRSFNTLLDDWHGDCRSHKHNHRHKQRKNTTDRFPQSPAGKWSGVLQSQKLNSSKIQKVKERKNKAFGVSSLSLSLSSLG